MHARVIKMNKHATNGVLLPELIDLIITDASQDCRLDPSFFKRSGIALRH